MYSMSIRKEEIKLLDKLKDFLFYFFVIGELMIYGVDVVILLILVGIIFVFIYFKKWKWLWCEWFIMVDYKKIGIMYMFFLLLMLFWGGVDVLLMCM